MRIEPITDSRGDTLLHIARGSLEEAFGGQARRLPEDEERGWLAAPGATFVTLARGEALRGCIGTLEAYRSLADDVYHNARAAAFEDNRFPPLVEAELDLIRIEVSVLTAPEPVAFENEAQLAASLRPGVDGVTLELGKYRGTFLPQVWERLDDPRRFLAQLKVKAGLEVDFWDSEIRVFRYTVRKWAESRLEGLKA